MASSSSSQQQQAPSPFTVICTVSLPPVPRAVFERAASSSGSPTVVKLIPEVPVADAGFAMTKAQLLEAIRAHSPVHGIYCSLVSPVDKEVLDAAGDSLRVVSTMSVGVDHIDVAECKARGIRVGFTPDVLTDTTADLAVALLLTTARRLPEAEKAVRAGEWGTWKPLWMCGSDVTGSTVGIVGMGRIGHATAKRLKFGFGCKILFSSRSAHVAEARELDAERVDFDELLARADFVSVHSALTPDTQKQFNREAFQKMKNTAILINTARGGHVDQEALAEALETGEIAAAGLDVTTPEPLPLDSKLLTLPNCVVLPHVGSASVGTRMRMYELAAENVVAGLAGTRGVFVPGTDESF